MKRFICGAMVYWIVSFCSAIVIAQDMPFDGLNSGLGNLARLSEAQSRSICPENPTGEKGKAALAIEGTGKAASRDLGKGWKVSPSVRIAGHSVLTLADITGSGSIQQIWLTASPLDKARFYILRMYWDDEAEPSVECPLGDFFACGWGRYCHVNSIPVCVNPGMHSTATGKCLFGKRRKLHWKI